MIQRPPDATLGRRLAALEPVIGHPQIRDVVHEIVLAACRAGEQLHACSFFGRSRAVGGQHRQPRSGVARLEGDDRPSHAADERVNDWPQ